MKINGVRSQVVLAASIFILQLRSNALDVTIGPSSSLQVAINKVRAGNRIPALDTVYFGNAASESDHGVVAVSSDIVTGGLGQPARRLLPLAPASYQGGTVTFTLKVDPSAPNYVTFKFWGSDRGERAGRLLLYSEGKQIGYRDQGDYDAVNQMEDLPLCPGRFVYTTLPLPPGLTNGKSAISLTLEPIGWIFQYGNSFEQRQKPFNQPSRGIYAAYTGTGAYFEPPAGEPRGVAPTLSVRPSPGPEVMDAVRARVNTFAERLCADPTKIDKTVVRDHANLIAFLAKAYQTPWCSAHNDARTLRKIVQEGDAYAILQSRDPGFVGSDWPGAGPLGAAVLGVYPALQAAKVLDETIDLAGGKKETRQQAWADTLKASVDYWQAHRRSYTNQSMIIDTHIYTANEGLRLLDASRALPRERVLGFLYQAMGIEPWTGSITAERSGGGADLPKGAYSEFPYGRHYYDMTTKGQGRELGYAAGYGETAVHWGSDIVRVTGDAKLRDQLAKLTKARAPFRYPLPDQDGYRALVLESIIDNRNGHYPGEVTYSASHGSRESEPMEAAVLTRDPVVIGMAQQCLADNQYFAYLTSHLDNGDPGVVQGLLNAVDDYEIVSKLPATHYRLPMSDGQPDFVWADEEDAVVAVKHGDRRLYFNFYYRAERAINGLVRIHDLTPRIERIVTARGEYQYTPSGHEYVREDWIDGIRGRGFPPPGPTVHQAWAGEKMPIQKRPDDAPIPAYGDWGPFVGKADFYSLVYDHYVIGVNGSAAKSYRLSIPKGARSVKDLTTGKPRKVTPDVTVAPMSTVVLYIDTNGHGP